MSSGGISSERCQFGTASVRNGVSSGWCRFGTMSVWNDVSSERCQSEDASVQGGVSPGWCQSAGQVSWSLVSFCCRKNHQGLPHVPLTLCQSMTAAQCHLLQCPSGARTGSPLSLYNGFVPVAVFIIVLRKRASKLKHVNWQRNVIIMKSLKRYYAVSFRLRSVM